MKMSFRWYGKEDPVSLQHIRQIPCMQTIVSAVYNIPVGEEWTAASIGEIRAAAAENGLDFEVVESVPVHEDIKLGLPTRDKYIEHYRTTIRRLGEAGVRVVCYNFMPVFDWLRSNLSHQWPDGSNSLAYEDAAVLAMDPATSELSLPGWDESYTKEGLRALLQQYQGVDKAALWNNLAYFLEGILPACEEAGIKMAIHPDDPPWDLFGLPRIITGADSYAALAKINSSPANGITLCLGSLGADANNDIPAIAERYSDRIHFVHARNILRNGPRDFVEAPHPSACGSLDMTAILGALKRSGFDGYIRPDHGRMIWGETGRPGYGLYDRALGAAYITGVWEALP